MERYILGIDIGTTSVKALLISESGALAAEGRADHDLISAHPGWAEENAEVWWSNTVAAVRQITDAHPDMAENIVSAGVSGMVPALALNGENFSTAAELLGRDLCHVHFIDIDLPKNGMCLAPGDGTLPMKDYLRCFPTAATRAASRRSSGEQPTTTARSRQWKRALRFCAKTACEAA